LIHEFLEESAMQVCKNKGTEAGLHRKADAACIQAGHTLLLDLDDAEKITHPITSEYLIAMPSDSQIRRMVIKDAGLTKFKSIADQIHSR
jgi:hypothetical protein